MKFLLCLFVIAAVVTTATAQSLEYGKPSELKGLKKVFVDTGGDIKNRD